MILNGFADKYGKKADILDTMFNNSDGELSDYEFAEICEYYEMEEGEVMMRMVNSEKYEFGRMGDRWTIKEKE